MFSNLSHRKFWLGYSIILFTGVFIGRSYITYGSLTSYFNLFYDTIFVVSILLQYFYFRFRVRRKDLFTLNHFYLHLFLISLLPTIYIFFPIVLDQLNVSLSPHLLSLNNYRLIYIYITTLFFSRSIALLRRLIFIKKSKYIHTLWQIYRVFLIGSFVFSFTEDLHFAGVLFYPYIVLSVLPIFFISITSKWIILIKFKNKLTIASLLLANTVISLIHLLNLFSFDGFFLGYSAFALLLGGLGAFFNFYTLLVLLFNLPVSKVMEEREAEVKGFQEINEIIQGKIKKQELFDRLLKICFNITNSNAGWVISEKKYKKSTFYHYMNVDDETVFSIGGIINVLTNMSKVYDRIYVPDVQKDPSFMHVIEKYRSFVFFPIVYKDQLIGKLFLIKSYTNGFNEYSVQIVESYIEQALLAFERAELIEQTIESERIHNELTIATNIQTNLLPKKTPTSDQFDIAAYSQAATEVGGDYFDFYTYSDGKQVVAIGDVSGKGVSAAFHMAEMKGIFQSLVQFSPTPKTFLEQANQAILNCYKKNVFITLTYLTIDAPNQKITYARAGHCPTLYYSAQNKKATYLQDDGIGLGIVDSRTVGQLTTNNEVNFKSDDILVLYSDGVTESKGKEDHMYGYDRLLRLIETNSHSTATDLIQKINSDIASFTEGSSLHDDTTIVVIRFK